MLNYESTMRPIKTITDPEAFQLLADTTRRQIVFLLRAQEMTVSQLAEHVKSSPQNVYHHIKKLVNAGMVEVSKEVRVDHLIESYYRATAEVFNCSEGQETKNPEAAKEQLKTVLMGLKKIGFKIRTDEKAVGELMEVTTQMHNCCKKGIYEEKIAELEDVDFVAKQVVSEYADMLSMSDEQFAKQQEFMKKFKNTLHSLVNK